MDGRSDRRRHRPEPREGGVLVLGNAALSAALAEDGLRGASAEMVEPDVPGHGAPQSVATAAEDGRAHTSAPVPDPGDETVVPAPLRRAPADTDPAAPSSPIEVREAVLVSAPEIALGRWTPVAGATADRLTKLPERRRFRRRAPPAAGEVDRLVTQYLARGGRVTVCPAAHAVPIHNGAGREADGWTT